MRTVMKRTLAVAMLAALTFAACGRPDVRPMRHVQSPIIGGILDNGHPAVVLIHNITENYFCSGTFIDPTTVLTAAHCTLDHEPTHYEIRGGVQAYSSPEWTVTVKVVDSDSRYTTVDGGFDVGIVIIDPEATVTGTGLLPTPMTWRRTGGNGPYEPGAVFTQVGYGVTNAVTAVGWGTKRKINLQMQGYWEDRYFYGDAAHNSCWGDSGGPAIAVIDGVEIVIGTASFAWGDCELSAGMRTDYANDWIDNYLGTVTPTPVPTPPALDEPKTGGCGVSL